MADFLADTTALLARTPAILRTLLVGLPDDWTDVPDVAGGWRPRDVVGHLITGEQTDWMMRTRRILEQGSFVPFDRFDRHAMLDRDAGVPLDQLVERFAALRSDNLAALANLVTDLSQIFAGLAGSRDAEVGPWKAYLGILLRREDPSAVPG